MKKLSTEALQVLGSMSTDGKVAYLPEGQLDRKLYTEVNKALEALGGKWNRKDKGHIFDEDPEGPITEVVNNGGFTDKKQELGFFQTPEALAKQLVESIDLQDGQRVLEPSAGYGRIVSAIIDHPARTNITCVEIDEAKKDVIHAALQLSLFGGILIIDDFLKVKPYEKLLYDRIAMNPPFAKQADIDHVTHALKHLKPGGRLGAIMSAAVKFRQNKKTTDFKKMLEAETFFEINDLPNGTFKSEDTGVSTVMLILTKKQN